MKLISKPKDSAVVKLFREYSEQSSPVSIRTYKQPSFCISQKVQNGTLLYNTVTGEMILLEDSPVPETAALQQDAPEEISPLRATLFEKGFLVSYDLNEMRLCDNIRDELRFLKDIKNPGYKTYTILPTTDCNARCFYCYEAGCEKLSMKPKDAERTAEFIKKTKAPGNIRIRWFGGEPTIGSSAIDRISYLLRTSNIQYTSSMISNAYLLDKEMIKKASDLWNLKTIQITLDGTEEIYNKRKAFPEDLHGAFTKVIGNIDSLLEAGIHIKIRLNADTRNTEDLSALISFLADKYSFRNDFYTYVSPIFSHVLNSSGSSAGAEARAGLYQHIQVLDQKIENLGLGNSAVKLPGLKLYNCISDDPSAVTVLPDGRLHACEHFNDNHFFGSIGEKTDKNDDLKYWREQYPHDNSCCACPLYPLCMRMLHCPDFPEYCIPEEKERRIHRLKYTMLKTYSHSGVVL